MCKDSNEDEWIYIVRTGSCRVIKALTQVRPKLKTRKKPHVIYDNFGTKRVSEYSMRALGTFNKVRPCISHLHERARSLTAANTGQSSEVLHRNRAHSREERLRK